ncbi:MAG: hypothetical protein KF868_19755 [Acidobacteria bacterium]|nr:hypothetical protein [Acidobacteriota bacterium]
MSRRFFPTSPLLITMLLWNLSAAWTERQPQNASQSNAAKAYQSLTEREPDNGVAWFRPGHSLRDARFKEVLTSAEGNANPCGLPVYRQLDFWVGEWNVFARGKQVGANSVQKILGDCVVFENWTDAAGRGGKSLNTFNRQKGKWQQTWMDDNGNVLEFTGEGRDGVMAYRAETVGPDGAKTLHRMTFTKLSDNRVRQFWEQSGDGGKTWNVAFDGDYQRKQ